MNPVEWLVWWDGFRWGMGASGLVVAASCAFFLWLIRKRKIDLTDYSKYTKTDMWGP